jgi:hypothetical protein
VAVFSKPHIEYDPPLVRASVAAPGRLRKVGLLGSHTNSLVYAPWDDPSWELWGHSSARYLYKRQPDLYFDLHRKECWTRRNNMKAQYPVWLSTNGVPIYMQAKHKEVPASRKYPLENVLMEIPERYRYFTNHVAYMIALALSQGVTHLGLFGINYGHRSEYQTQRGSAEFWLGVAHGRGVHLVLPGSSTLLQEPKGLYGYNSHDENGKLEKEYQFVPAVVTEQTETPDGKRLTLHPPESVPLATRPAEITDEMVAEDEAERVPSSLCLPRL